MNIIFVSNYFNHHQQPCSDKLYQLCKEQGGSYIFMQTEAMEEERVQMGWGEVFKTTPYLMNYWDNPKDCQALIDKADAVVFGGTDEEGYIQNRLKNNKPVWRYSERLYKSGRYKFISPRGLVKKFKDHTRYAGRRVYLLCAGAYVAGDFRLVASYFDRKFKYGYFPACKKYDIEKLMAEKSYQKTGIPMLFWAARMIDWKHPEIPIELAASLKEKGYSFRMNIAGGGALEKSMHELAEKLQVEDCIIFLGNQNPEIVRKYMEACDIYLATSDNGEGWGAVINEAMNSGCAVVANKLMGAGPYLIKHEINGFLYPNHKTEELLHIIMKLLDNPELREEIGRRAYEQIVTTWNAELAAQRLFACMQAECCGRKLPTYSEGPLSKHKF